MLRGSTFGKCAFQTTTTRIETDSDVHFAILLLLASAASDGMTRDEIVQILWPDSGVAGRHCLRQTIYRLRTLGVLLRAGPKRVALADDDSWSDVHHVLHSRPTREEMVRFGTIPFLPSYAPKVSDAFRRWVEELRGHVAGRLRHILAEEVIAARANGRFHEVGKIARALLAQDPLNEIGTLGLAESLALEGSKIEALRMLDDYEAEVGSVNEALRLAPRVLRRRVSECLDDTLLPRRFDLPFVGREREFDELRASYHDSRAGSARCAVLTGEAGIGKTRLATEMMRRAALDGTTATSYAASAGDTFTPISTLVSVGQLLLSLPGALGCAHEHLHYVRRLGTPETVNLWSATGMAADIAYAQLVHSLAELVRALADEAPLILLIDDAQRLHQTSWRVLFDILDRAADSRFLLILATRRLPAWFGSVSRDSCGQLTRHLRLAPFSPNESLDFMQHWSAKNGVALSSDDAATCAETSAGNPFYLGELAAHTARGGALRLYPKSIRELIEIQYVAVSKGAQRLLLVIALFEGRGTLSRVTQIMDLGADEFMAALDELEEAGLITAKGAQVRCKHELVAETAIQLAMEGVQSFARVRIAEYLEREADETNSVELLGDCVTHWERAGEMKRAYLAAMKLGNRLVGLGMGTEAEAAFQSARANAETSDEIIGAIEGQVTASRLCANWPRVISGVASRASWVPKRLRPSTCDTDFELADAEARMFAFDGSATVPRLISLACDRAASRDARLRAATITAMYGDNNYSLQHIREAWNSIGDLQQNIGEDLDHLLLEMVFHTTVGRTDLAQAIATQYGSNACADADKRVAVHGVRRAGNALIRIGQPREAQHFLEESLLMCKKFKLPYQEFASLDLLVTSHLAIGNLDTCHSLLNRMAEIGGESRTLHMRAMLFVGESLVAWLEGGAPRRRRWIESEQIDSDTWMLSPRHGFLNAILARAVLLDGVSEVSAVIEECVRLHILGRDLGGQDLRTAILLDAMRVAGRRSESDILEVDYLSKHRRDMTPSVINFAPTRSRVVE